jgi:hypothetical protein
MRDEFEERIEECRASGSIQTAASYADAVLRLAGKEARARGKLAALRVKQLLDSGWRTDFVNGVIGAFLDMYSQHDHWRKDASSDLHSAVERAFANVPMDQRSSPLHPGRLVGEYQVESSNEEMADLICYAARYDIFSNATSVPSAQAVLERIQPHYDVFVSHASEDKVGFVNGLVAALRAVQLSVWYDEFEIGLGDVLTIRIDEGLASSRFGVVVLSKAFFAKRWPRVELDALANREISGGRKVMLPILYGIEHEEVAAHSPILAAKLAARSTDGIEVIVERIVAELRRPAE